MPSIFNPTLFVIIVGVWLVLFVAGMAQLNLVKKRTTAIVLDEFWPALRADRDLTLDAYYALVDAQWQPMLRRTALFVLHKTELWPMPANAAYVRQRINFTPAWVGAYLALNGRKLRCTPEQQAAIDAILAQARRPQRPQS